MRAAGEVVVDVNAREEEVEEEDAAAEADER